MHNDTAYRRAKRKVEARLGFYFHLTVYLVVNGLIFIGSPETFPRNFWCFWPWTIFLFIHGMRVFRLGSGLKKRMIQNELDKASTSIGNNGN